MSNDKREWVRISAMNEPLVMAMKAFGKTFLTFSPLGLDRGCQWYAVGSVIAVDEIDLGAEIHRVADINARLRAEREEAEAKMEAARNEQR